MTSRRATPTPPGPARGSVGVPGGRLRIAAASVPAPHAPLARGCRPRGCRAPARRVHGRRVRYVIGDEPGQVNGMRWRRRPARTSAN
ncbi:tryptophan synthase subunit(beta) [Streptomyces sp. NPDC006553]|uniref:tryptophan biosynthesis modulator TrpM n=1 Tax=unclassified Streptomyces TaxID=2593676 RepID=UPI00224DFF70|nr:tryptophan synthase subunit(beta) [Streptomyces sp. NBC_00233]MCX5225619.1 tryptophan synthase subunit(beta) [Streptomyces sp. NBC_00233]